MKKLLLLVAATFIFAAAAPAQNIVPLPIPGGAGQNVLGNTFTFNNLTFSNFTVINAGNVPNPLVTLTSANLIDGRLFLTFNPNLGFTAADANIFVKDIQLSFTVSGPLNAIDLSLLGTNGVVTETACSGAFVGGVCVGNILGNITNNSLTPLTLVNLPQNVNFVGIFKDILISRNCTDLNNPLCRGELTVVNQSFGSNPIPEPATMILLGTGLAGVAAKVRRRRKSE